MSELQSVVRSSLTEAMRAKDRSAVSALRSLLARLANAEAVPVSTMPRAGALEDSRIGVGAADAERRTLSPSEERALVRAEITEREAAASLVAATHTHRVEELRAEIAVLTPFLAPPARPWPLMIGEVVLREATEPDIDRLLSFRNEPAVNRFMMRTHVDPDQFRRTWLAIPTSESDFSCVAERDGRLVAMGFLEIQDGSGQPGMPTGTEGLIGYIVEPGVWRTGVATAVTRGLLEAAFGSIGLRRVVAYCNADNPGSVRALEKAGMRREQHGIQDSWHAELGWVDGYQYAMLHHEWTKD